MSHDTVSEIPLTPEEATKHQAEEIAHAKHHLIENYQFFGAFFSLILVSVLTSSYFIDLGLVWNRGFGLALLIVRWAIMAWFFAVMIGRYKILSRTFLFTFFFLLGMIILTTWCYNCPIVGIKP